MPPGVAVRGTAPRGASSDGPPAPHRLEQPFPCTSPISDVLRRPRGHRHAGSNSDGKLCRRPPCGARLPFTRATETASQPTLAERLDDDRDAFHRDSTRLRFPSSKCLVGCLVGKLDGARAPFSPRSRRCVRQHVVRSAPRPASRRRLALRLTERRDARCVGPVSAISLLRTSTRASSVPGASERFRASRSRRDHLLHGRAIRFGGPHDLLMFSTAAGLVFPSRCVRTEPLTPLSPPPGLPVTLARSRSSPRAAETAASPLA